WYLFLALFLLLFLFAILTSSFSLYEIIVSAFTASGKYSRPAVSLILGIVLFIVAIPAALSESTLSEVSIAGNNIFDATDFLVSNIMLPLGSLLIALFIMHRAEKSFVHEQYVLGNEGKANLYQIWRFLMTWVVPVTIIIVYISLIGIF